ncbi:MAG: glycerol-3-phosphate responsive antiterminator [Spirochaetaceae bacterium]|jgi:glycerol uptake operon antiterminator|nr:glycerol-3-phosphate responsive antiterminator [Spirochaetaceae bacterium]
MQNILIKKKDTASPDVFYEVLHSTPVILAVKSMDGLEKSITGGGRLMFVLFGDILSIPCIVSKIKDAGKIALVHIDLIDGLTSRDIVVDFIAENTRADGILSTKTNLLKRAKSRGLLAVQRFFVLDSMSLINIEKQFPLDYADAVEILPGVIPKIIRRIVKIINKPVIAGGLVSDTEDVQHALEAGAVSVSSSNMELASVSKLKIFETGLGKSG